MNLNFLAYHIPFKKRFQTAKNDFNSRTGCFIRLQKDGITAWGEAAPLPGFSSNTFEEMKNKLIANKPLITQFFNTDFTKNKIDSLTNSFQQFPALQFGLFTAGSNYLAQQKKESAAEYLFNQAAECIDMNAVIDLSDKNIISTIEARIKEGFNTLKIKVGDQPRQSLQQIKQIRAKYSGLTIRLDANQSWSLDEAITFLSKVEPYQIEYCEEPLKKSSVQNLLMLKGKVSTPLALDETMRYWPKIEDQAFIADFLTQKPMIMGGRATVNDVHEFAQKHNKELIFTTSLGTAVERLMVATLAAEFGSTRHAHGLNTGRLLQNDLWKETKLTNDGQFLLPDSRQLKHLMNAEGNNIDLNKI